MEKSPWSEVVAHRNGIQAMVLANQLFDTTLVECDVLNEVLTKIDSVLSLSIDVPAVASSVLDSLQRAYTYLHEITQARLVLGETSRKALDEFDAAFKRYLERKLNEEEEEQTSEELVKCEQLAEEAVQEAKGEYSKLKELKLEEISLGELEKIESSARGMLSKEEETINNDKEEMRQIGGQLAELEEVSDRCDVEFKKTVVELRAEALMNRCCRERLNEQLLWLKKKKRDLKTTAGSGEEKQHLTDRRTTVTRQIEELEQRLKITVGILETEEYFQHEGDEMVDSYVEKFSKWRDKLNSRFEQVEKSTQVLDIMDGCVELVMDSAREKNATWEQMKLTYLLQLRDALMSVASYHMVRAESLSEDGTVQQQIQESVVRIQDELAVTNEEIKTLKPHLQLDTLQERIESQKRGSLKRDAGRSTEHDHLSNHQVKKRKVTSAIQDHPCKYCKRSFNRLGNLKDHLLIHTEEKNYECTHCQKRFARQNQLSRHMLTHTGGKPHECTECHTRFTIKSNLKRHMLTAHTEETLYECTECQRKFSAKRYLRYHMRSHTGENTHTCSECQKIFLEKCQLTRHMLIHTGEKPHECTECHRRFAVKCNMQRHMLTHRRTAQA